MREFEPAGPPAIEPAQFPRDGRASRPHLAIVVSLAVHGLALYGLTQQQFPSITAPRRVADYFVFELPRLPRAAEASPDGPAVPVAERVSEPPPVPEAEPGLVPDTPPAGELAPESAERPSERRATPAEVLPVAPAEAAPPAPRGFIDFDEERRRAARNVVGEREAANEYLTFSLDDVAPPRPEPKPKPRRSIFDGGFDAGARSVGTVGQQRTKLGRRLAEVCNALTGGIGFGLFSACAAPNTAPTGLFPEVRPRYLDLQPDCVDTRDTAPALALEAPFPTVKCRLVKRNESEERP